MATQIFNFKMENELKEELRKTAETDGRTMSGAIKHLIRGYVDERKNQ